MAKIVSTNAQIIVGTTPTDLSDWCKQVTVDWGQETRDISTFTTGTPMRLYRSGAQTATIEATFYCDHAAGGPEAILRAHVLGTSDTGFPVNCRPVNGAVTATNPMFAGTAIYDGALTVLNDEFGEVAEITARFLPYSAWEVTTTAT